MPEHGQVVEEAQDGAAGAELGRGGQEPPGQPRGPGQRCPRQLAAVGQRPDLQSPREGMLQPGLLISSFFHPLFFSPPLSLFLSLLLSLIHLSLFSFSSLYPNPIAQVLQDSYTHFHPKRVIYRQNLDCL